MAQTIENESITAKPTSSVRVAVVDDHESVRLGLKAAFREEGYDFVLAAANVDELVAGLEGREVDVVVLDLSLGDGVSITDNVKACQATGAGVLIHSIADRAAGVREALAAGAAGVIPKSAATAVVMAAIRTVARGEVFLDPAATKTLLRGYLGRVRSGDELDLGEVLSEREREGVRLTAEGHTAQQAAEILALSPKTVETYRHRAMQKLGLTNRAELVRYALRAGLLAADEA